MINAKSGSDFFNWVFVKVTQKSAETSRMSNKIHNHHGWNIWPPFLKSTVQRKRAITERYLTVTVQICQIHEVCF